MFLLVSYCFTSKQEFQEQLQHWVLWTRVYLMLFNLKCVRRKQSRNISHCCAGRGESGSQMGAWCNTSRWTNHRGAQNWMRHSWLCLLAWLNMSWHCCCLVPLGHIRLEIRSLWQWHLSWEWQLCFLLLAKVAFAVLLWPSLKSRLSDLGAGGFCVGCFQFVWGLLQQAIFSDSSHVGFKEWRWGGGEMRILPRNSALDFINVCLSTPVCTRYIL